MYYSLLFISYSVPKWNRLMWWAMRHDAVLQEFVNFCDSLSYPGSMQTDYWNLLRCWSYVSIETYKRPYSDLLRSWLRYIGKEVKMRICWVPRLRAFVTTNLRSFLWWDHRWAWGHWDILGRKWKWKFVLRSFFCLEHTVNSVIEDCFE